MRKKILNEVKNQKDGESNSETQREQVKVKRGREREREREQIYYKIVITKNISDLRIKKYSKK